MSLRYVFVKLLRAAATIWLVVTFVFFVLRLSGDPVGQLLPDDVDQRTIDFYRAAWGLDEPLLVQYGRYLEAMLRGDFGISFRNNLDAFDLVMERLPKTALLGGTALLLALTFAIPLGIWAALHKNTVVDQIIMGGAVFGFSIPNFFLGILLILVFSLQLRWLPSSGSGTLAHLVMPAITLATTFGAQIARYTRSAMIDVANRAYMRTAEAKGAGHTRTLYVHALPNAAIPIVTITGMKLGELLGWAVVTETVFAWPGLGRLLTNAVANRDLAVVQCIMLVLAATMVAANLLVDLAYGWLDPRVRGGGREAAR